MGTLDPVEEKPVILFDGLCNLCNGSVQFIINRDAKAYFRFAALQSPLGQYTLHKFGLPVNQLHSIILIKDGILFQKSNAALEVVKSLGTESVTICSYLNTLRRGGVNCTKE